MPLIVFIGAAITFIFSWILWAVIALPVFFCSVYIPWLIWEGFMYLTFNNLINLLAKGEGVFGFLGKVLAFIIMLPFAGVSTVLSLWAYFQTVLMGILTFHGAANSVFCKNFIQNYVVPWETDFHYGMIIVRWYYDYMQCIWGGSSFMVAYYPWQNGVMMAAPTEVLPVPMMIIKLVLLSIPFTIMFVVPLVPIIRSFNRAIVAAMGKLPSISGNGD